MRFNERLLSEAQMKKILLILLFVVLIGSASAESAVAPTPAPASLLSFSITPNLSIPFGSDGTLGNHPKSGVWFSPGVGGTISFQYRTPAALYVGADLGYSFMDINKTDISGMSLFLAGLTAGIHRYLASTVGVSAFALAGYSYYFLNRNLGRGGAPFAGAGAELSWTFVPALSLTAGAKYRYFLDVFADLSVSLGISYNLPVGNPKAVRLSQRLQGKEAAEANQVKLIVWGEEK
jgi:hypothetical protein